MTHLVKIILAFCVIVATFVLADYFFGLFADTTFKAALSKQSYVMTTRDDYNLVFFGSSRAQHHYDTGYITDSLGISSFNAGEDGRGITYQLPLISSYIEKNNPKLIVLETFGYLDGSWNDRISLLYPLADSNYFIIKTAEIIDPNNKLFLKSNFYRHNGNLVPEVKNIIHPFKLTDNKGFVPNSAETPLVSLKELNEKNNFPPDVIEIKVLSTILELCRKKNINIIGVNSPIFTSTKSARTADSVFRAYGYHFIDNTGFRMPYPPEDYFRDPAHLNDFGAREYTKFFMSQITDSLKLL